MAIAYGRYTRRRNDVLTDEIGSLSLQDRSDNISIQSE